LSMLSTEGEGSIGTLILYHDQPLMKNAENAAVHVQLRRGFRVWNRSWRIEKT
jgi:hypothetical protein